MALMSVRFGTNDADRASIFYDAIFAALGLHDIRVPMGPTVVLYALPGGLHFMLASPRDGKPATYGNGDILGFVASDFAMVDRWHAEGLAHGGLCEGAPGIREEARGRYGAYLRDPDGHKICVYASA